MSDILIGAICMLASLVLIQTEHLGVSPREPDRIGAARKLREIVGFDRHQMALGNARFGRNLFEGQALGLTGGAQLRADAGRRAGDCVVVFHSCSRWG